MKPAVLLLAHGTPDTDAGVPEFLKFVTGGRELPEHVVEEIRRRYALIGHSPLTEITHRQAQALARRLDLPVYVGMRNWHPFIPPMLDQMRRDGIDRAVAICLAPQNSRTSVGLYKKALGLADAGSKPPFEIAFIESWHDHPMLVRAFVQKLERAWKKACAESGANVPLIFTAHSVPERTIAEGDPYAEQAKQTAARVADEIEGLSEWKFAFQSQGQSGGAWIGPTVEDTIAELERTGHKSVLIQPVGFLADHVEILYDIDIAFRELAQQKGMKLWRTESLNDSPLLISALADLAGAHLGMLGASARGAR
jgi:protoporphyrin/coproporphyrin ferrochelatase